MCDSGQNSDRIPARCTHIAQPMHADAVGVREVYVCTLMAKHGTQLHSFRLLTELSDGGGLMVLRLSGDGKRHVYIRLLGIGAGTLDSLGYNRESRGE